MNDKRDIPSHDAGDDGGLDSLLGVLQAPAPSDLLKVRIENALHEASPSAALAPDAARSTPSRRAFYARAAAAVIVAGLVGFGILSPAPQPGELAPVGSQLAGGTVAGSVGQTRGVFADGRTDEDTQGSAQDGVLGLTLVGEGGAPVTAIGLVSVNWDGGNGATDTDFERASFDGTSLDDTSALGSIPLD